MKRILLFLVLFSATAAAQWSIAPRTLENSKIYSYEVPKLKRDIAYKWVISARGTANFIVRISSLLGTVSSGYKRLDSVVIPAPGSTGFTDFTLTMTGDSLMNMLLPDDTGSLGTAGALLKAKDGWKAKLEIVTAASGNAGILVVADGVGASYAPPPDDDTYAYTRWVATVDYVTPQQLSDSLDHIPRTAGAGSAAAVSDSLDRETSIGARTARRIADSLALRAIVLGDSLARILLALGDSLGARYLQIQSWVIARSYLSVAALTDSLNANVFRAPKTGAEFPYGGGIRSVLTWLMEDSSATRAGIWAGNYTWPGPYNDPVFTMGINMDNGNPHQARVGLQFENKYASTGTNYMGEWHIVYDAPGTAPAVRLATATGSHISGRGIDLGLNVDRFYIRNGGGQSTSIDSTLAYGDPPKNGSPGTFSIFNGYLTFENAVSLGTLVRAVHDSGYMSFVDYAQSSRLFTFGAAGGTSDYWRPQNVQLRAGEAGVLAERTRNRLTLTGRIVRLDQSAFGASEKDSQSVSSTNYVETLVAAERTTSANEHAALRDSSRGWRTFVRPAALDTCIDVDSSTAGLYVLSINIDCIRDSGLLGPMLDKMYARSGGSATPTDSVHAEIFAADTTGGWFVDSCYVYRNQVYVPRGSAAYKVGWVEYTVSITDQMTGKAYFEVDIAADTTSGWVLTGCGQATVTVPSSTTNNARAMFGFGDGDVYAVTRYVGNGGRNPCPTLVFYQSGTSTYNYRRTLRVSTIGAYIYSGMTITIRIEVSGTSTATGTWYATIRPGRGA